MRCIINDGVLEPVRLQERELPLLVVNSTSLATLDCMNDSDTIIGVQARSQPYLRTSIRNGSLYERSVRQNGPSSGRLIIAHTANGK